MKAKILTFVRGLKNGTPPRFQSYLKSLILLLVMMMSVNVWGEETSPLTCTFPKSGTYSSPVTVNNISWAISTTSGSGSPSIAFGSAYSNNCIKFGTSASKCYGSVTFSTDYFKNNNLKVTAVELNVIGNANGNTVLTVGSKSTSSTAFKSTSWTKVSLSGLSETGTLSIKATIGNVGYFVNYIKVTFEEATVTPVTSLNLYIAGSCTDDKTGHNVGDTYTLPSKTDVVCGTKSLAGWSTVEITNPVENQPTSNFYAPGAQVTLKENNKFYAVFADKSGNETEYVRITQLDELSDGMSLVVVGDKNSHLLKNNISSASAPTESNSKIMVTPSTDAWTLRASGAKWQLCNSSGALGASSTSNGTSVSINNNNNTWTVGKSSSGTNNFYFNVSGTICLEDNNGSWVVYSNKSYTSSDYFTMRLYKANVSFSNYTTTCSSDPLIEGLTITPSKEPTEGLYWEPITATIGCTTTEVTIKYSLDGSEPSISYDGTPINITETSTLKVKATRSGYQDASKSQTFTFGKVYENVDAYLADKANIENYEKIKINYLRVTITSIASSKETINFSGASLHVSDVTCPTNWATNGILVAKNQIYTARVFDNGSSYQLRPSSWNVLTYVTNLPNVTGLSETNITSSSVTLNWTAVTNAGSYKVKFNGEEKDATTETSMTISDLHYNTQYSWYVKALTSNLDVATDGNYGSAKNFTTLDIPHTVTFHAGDKGTCATSSLTETATGAGVTLPEVTNVAIGYDFKGWSSSPTPTSANAGAAGATYKPADDIDLYAYYTPQVYTITYLDKGGEDFSGSWGTHPTQHTYGTVTNLVNPTKAHYDFAGWYLTSDCSGEPLTNLAADGYLDNITLYAKWNEHAKYTVTFVDDVQGTDCSSWNLNNEYINTQIVFHSISDKTRKVPDGDCVTDHYHFVGWVEDGTIPTKEPDNVIKAGTNTIKVTKDVTYKAVWAKEL